MLLEVHSGSGYFSLGADSIKLKLNLNLSFCQFVDILKGLFYK